MTASAITRTTDDGIVISVLVQPRASKCQVAGVHGGAVKLRLTAPPVEGAANKMCIAFLAKTLGLPKSAVEIVAGHTSRTKQVLVRPAPGQTREGLQHLIDQRLVVS